MPPDEKQSEPPNPLLPSTCTPDLPTHTQPTHNNTTGFLGGGHKTGHGSSRGVEGRLMQIEDAPSHTPLFHSPLPTQAPHYDTQQPTGPRTSQDLQGRLRRPCIKTWHRLWHDDEIPLPSAGAFSCLRKNRKCSAALSPILGVALNFVFGIELFAHTYVLARIQRKVLPIRRNPQLLI